MLTLGHVALFAFLGSLTWTGLSIFAGILDKPVDRSSHIEPTPTAGGLGIWAGLAIGFFAIAKYHGALADGQMMLGILMLVSVAALMGLVDDLFDTNPVFRFSLMIGVAFLMVSWIGPPTMFPLPDGAIAIAPWLGWGGAILWVVVVINAVNFMDGANGLMAVSMTIAALCAAFAALYVGATASALFAAVIAGAGLGFWPYNSKTKADIFSGDVGSLALGMALAALGLLLARETHTSGGIYIVPIVLLPFLADVLLTLIVRVSRKEKLWKAHREHLYHKALDRGQTHVSIARDYGIATTLCGGVAFFAVKFGATGLLTGLLIGTFTMILLYVSLRQKWTAD